MSMELALREPAEMMKMATSVAEICKEIIAASSKEIEGRKYLMCEGWQAIANCFGMIGSARDVEKVYDPQTEKFAGFKAIGELRRISDNQLIATSEGFVGEDEVLWFGGIGQAWDKKARKYVRKEYHPRPEFAIRSMCQTRAISKVCKGAFAFVVVILNSQQTGKRKDHYSTTPAEEMGEGHGDNFEGRELHGSEPEIKGRVTGDGEPSAKDWRNYACSFGKRGGPLRGKQLGELTDAQLAYLHEDFCKGKREIEKQDEAMVEGLNLWMESRKASR